ncbi:MAG: toll/interleukin-1 receptor domain-containing protein [Marmoricola sp.]
MHSPRLRSPLIRRGCELPCVRRAVAVPLLLLLLRRFVVVWRRAGIDIRVVIVRRLTSRRTRTGRSVSYSPSEWRAVEPYAEKAAEQARTHPDRRDLFLCHAWDDRQGSAADLHRQLKANGATVWFSEEDIPLGSLMTREIDKGLRNSRIGIVLVTPALLKSIRNEGIAEKELAVLLNSRRVVPVTHGVTFDELYDVSPMLASHAGLSTAESSLDDVAAKIAAAAAALPAA